MDQVVARSETQGFELDERLAADTIPITMLGLCELRLMNDRRWPWLILVPKRRHAEEIHRLTPLDQASLAFESAEIASVLQAVTGCQKINSGALGNVVRQLHWHVVARSEGDANWPHPVWGFGERQPYEKGEGQLLAERIAEALSA